MSTALADCEDPKTRKTWKEGKDTYKSAVFDVHRDDLGSLPAEGDPFPGDADAATGPFIVRGGIKFGQFNKATGKHQVTITAVTVGTRSEA